MFLDRLIEKQRNLGMSDAAFAAYLGVPRATWQLTRTRGKPIRMRVLAAALRRFPDLSTEASSFLRGVATDVAQATTGEK